jgi:hypothetical protein
MIAASNHKFRILHTWSEKLKGFHHEFQSLVRAPLTKGENAMFGISAPREIRQFRPARKNSMCAQMYVVAAVLVIQNFAVPGHQNRNRIRKQKHPGRDRTSNAIKTFMAHASVLQFHCIHQMMQCDVRVTAAQA